MQTFSILYLNNEKSKEFLLNYFRKLINEKEENLISYLENTYDVVERLTENDKKQVELNINKEREI